MTISRTLLAATAAASALLLAACGSNVKLDEGTKAPVETRTGTAPGAGSTGAGTGAPQSRVTPVDLTAQNQAANALGRVVYFDFDSFVVKEEFRGLIEGHAKTLNADRKKRVVVEGHTDERGGREYNLALGQKRAEAVTRSLALLGATDAQLEAVSYGEERPAAAGSDEAAWAKNRRAELVTK
jgi:peptidoglycan-associated lipoprotein